jgi:Tol biopolymer transport system component
MKKMVVLFAFFILIVGTDSVLARVMPDIVFIRKPYEVTGFDTGNEIYTIDINGGNLTRLTDDDYAQLWPRFSPNPADPLISFYANPESLAWSGGVYVMEVDGQNPRRVAGDGSGDQSWSPDGSRLVVQKFNPLTLKATSKNEVLS